MSKIDARDRAALLRELRWLKDHGVDISDATVQAHLPGLRLLEKGEIEEITSGKVKETPE